MLFSFLNEGRFKHRGGRGDYSSVKRILTDKIRGKAEERKGERAEDAKQAEEAEGERDKLS